MKALRVFLNRQLAYIGNPYLRGVVRGMLYGYALAFGYLTAAAVACVLEAMGWIR
jgi:hypothetical protein